jgi:pilus assembly protein CpaD
VIRRFIRKDAKMASKSALLLVAVALGGCNTTVADQPDRGLSPVNVPVVVRADYVFDAAASGDRLAPGEDARLDNWFRGLGLGYGDTIYVDSAYAGGAAADVARLAGNYGMMVTPGAPVTAGAVQPGALRVVVSRNRAEVPNCPNWSGVSQPNFDNRTMPNFGCAVNGNIAAMVANPQDLIHGREGSGVVDTMTATKAVGVYRATPPTGTQGLQEIDTKKDQ